MKSPRWRSIAISLLPLALFLIAWQLFSAGSDRRQFLFASPLNIARVAIDELTQGAIYMHILVTLWETVLGLILGTIFGTSVGLSLWANRTLGQYAAPYVAAIGAIPIFALAPMLIIWFGTGLAPKVIMAGFPVALVSLIQVYNGARRIDESHGEWLVGLNASRWLTLRAVIVPECTAVVFEGMKLNVGFALVGAFIGEFVVASRGLGHFILRAGGVYDTPRVLFGVILFGLLALGLTALIAVIQRRLQGERG